MFLHFIVAGFGSKFWNVLCFCCSSYSNRTRSSAMPSKRRATITRVQRGYSFLKIERQNSSRGPFLATLFVSPVARYNISIFKRAKLDFKYLLFTRRVVMRHNSSDPSTGVTCTTECYYACRLWFWAIITATRLHIFCTSISRACQRTSALFRFCDYELQRPSKLRRCSITYIILIRSTARTNLELSQLIEGGTRYRAFLLPIYTNYCLSYK